MWTIVSHSLTSTSSHATISSTNHRGGHATVLHIHLAALALVAVTFAAAGCGGSSKTTTATATTASSTTTPDTTTSTSVAVVKLASGRPLTRAQWLARGDAICARLNSQLGANTVKSTKEFARALPVAAAYERAELARLVKLVPPPSMATDWQQFLTSTQQWAENSTKLGESAQGGHFTLTAPLVITTRNLHEHLAGIAKRDGFKECSLV